jgi:hypothetical protein
LKNIGKIFGKARKILGNLEKKLGKIWDVLEKLLKNLENLGKTLRKSWENLGVGNILVQPYNKSTTKNNLSSIEYFLYPQEKEILSTGRKSK